MAHIHYNLQFIEFIDVYVIFDWLYKLVTIRYIKSRYLLFDYLFLHFLKNDNVTMFLTIGSEF